MRLRNIILGAAAVAALVAGARMVMTRPPVGVEAVHGFDVSRYMGRWYEIARLDHRFERGMSDVSATYTLEPDGSVRVINRGRKAGEWRSVQGTARFRGDPSVASLSVSFFPGIPGGYHVFALDPEYRWAVISGPTRGFLWILAREPAMDEPLYARLVQIARDRGFAVGELLRVSHGASDG